MADQQSSRIQLEKDLHRRPRVPHDTAPYHGSGDPGTSSARVITAHIMMQDQRLSNAASDHCERRARQCHLLGQRVPLVGEDDLKQQVVMRGSRDP